MISLAGPNKNLFNILEKCRLSAFWLPGSGFNVDFLNEKAK